MGRHHQGARPYAGECAARGLIMSSGRSLAVFLILAIVVVRAWFNGHLGEGLGALFSPIRGIGQAES